MNHNSDFFSDIIKLLESISFTLGLEKEFLYDLDILS